MANCVQCGRELPAFSFGQQSNLCVDCKRQQQISQPTDPTAPQPQQRVRPGIAAMARMFPVTAFIVAVNLAIYVGCAIYSLTTHLGSPAEFNTLALLMWGADFGPLTLDGQWWRIFTSMWLHGGIIHVGANMYCFWDIGRVAERVYGRERYASVYLITGLASSVASLLIHPMTVSVGASGAIFGVAGALVFPFYRKRLQLPGPVMKSMMRSLGYFIVINLVIGTVVPVIDNSAHVGGLIAGLILGMIWTLLAEKHVDMNSAKWKVLAASLLVIAAGFVGVRRLHGDRVLAAASLFASDRGDLSSAEQKARRAVAQRPNDADSHTAMGEVLFKKGQFADAAKEYEAAARIDPKDAYLQQQIGASYVALNKWKEAEGPLRAALKMAPNDADIQLDLGIALAGMGRYAEGLMFVQRSLHANPQSARAQFTYGSLLASKGNFIQAVPPLKEAVRLDPTDADYKKALEQAEAQVGK